MFGLLLFFLVSGIVIIFTLMIRNTLIYCPYSVLVVVAGGSAFPVTKKQ